MHGKRKCMQDFQDNLNERDISENATWMKTGLKEKERKGVNEINLAQDMDQWQIRVNMVIHLQVPDKVGSFFTTGTIITFLGSTLPHGLSELIVIQFPGH
jgi:3-phenylpropionate/cinnamic acid dioxygenase small subunit